MSPYECTRWRGPRPWTHERCLENNKSSRTAARSCAPPTGAWKSHDTPTAVLPHAGSSLMHLTVSTAVEGEPVLIAGPGLRLGLHHSSRCRAGAENPPGSSRCEVMALVTSFS